MGPQDGTPLPTASICHLFAFSSAVPTPQPFSFLQHLQNVDYFTLPFTTSYLTLQSPIQPQIQKMLWDGGWEAGWGGALATCLRLLKPLLWAAQPHRTIGRVTTSLPSPVGSLSPDHNQTMTQGSERQPKVLHFRQFSSF